jgi:hypothetical protein
MKRGQSRASVNYYEYKYPCVINSGNFLKGKNTEDKEIISEKVTVLCSSIPDRFLLLLVTFSQSNVTVHIKSGITCLTFM